MRLSNTNNFSASFNVATPYHIPTFMMKVRTLQ